jgi:UDP-N-acetylglucosamine:LPS N-acetylglucosamine transferase
MVVSASMGAGHDAAAGELVRRLLSAGHVAERVDVLALGRRGAGRRLKATYSFLLRRAPWVYDSAMRVWARWPRPLERLTARGSTAFDDGLQAAVARVRPDVVVAVYNLAGQALGRLRASGRLPVPVATYVTDPGAHPYWVHPAVDLHMTVLPRTARALRSYGARRTALVAPLVGPRFSEPLPSRGRARRDLGLPGDAVVALVAAGSWAAGDLAGTVSVVARAGRVLPVAMCGRDEALRGRLARQGVGLALGWTDDVPLVMAAADVLVDNAGGLTCWEALSCGLPVVLFRPLPGHGRLNAEALEAAGLTAYARDEEQLGMHLASLTSSLPGGGGAARPARGLGDQSAFEDPVDLVVGLPDVGPAVG